jgi:hypothetical protein
VRRADTVCVTIEDIKVCHARAPYEIRGVASP